ncbi:V-set and immunoglobulin domain-containing protein 10 [Nibea albiflora]|nr:V-set and immunoglobulin domain-containing protein 10 [Nibea albiflora]
MKIVATVALLQLCLSATAEVSGNGSNETVVTAESGDIVLLPCYGVGTATQTLTTWMKDGREVVRGGGSSPTPAPAGQRLAVLPSGTLNINGAIPGDEGTYLCNSTIGNISYVARVVLQVASGPENVSTSIGPATALSNGTLIAFGGTTISFNCSGSSYPSQELRWSFTDVPDRHPECMWAPAQDPSHIQFNCTWFGAYPTPTLRWGEDQGVQGDLWKGYVYASEVTASLSVTLNRSKLYDGQTLRCMAQHLALAPGKKKSCSFTLKPPYPQGEPLAMAQETTSVTLTCTETTSIPPASTTWRKGLKQEVIVPGSKYALSEEGPSLKLTIHNISKDDEGVYFCRSENPLSVRELEVYLTVRTSSAYTGAIIGIFIAALIVGSAAIIAKTVYSNRHRVCLGNFFRFRTRTSNVPTISPFSRHVEEDRGDVLSLVESEDENIFQDDVPRLPPLTNGCYTTLVQIHRIPSSDHEDLETAADTSPEQQEESVQTEEPVDLVTF